jgi:HSP20 family protein
MLIGFRDFDRALRAFDELQRRIDQAFDPWADPALSRDRSRVRAHAAWPPTNVFETKESFVVRAEVPGLADKDVSVSVEDDSLVVRGERKSDIPQGHTVHLRERLPVSFVRKLPLPARVDADAVSASLRDGVLTITLPKAKDSLPRQIAVKAG